MFYPVLSGGGGGPNLLQQYFILYTVFVRFHLNCVCRSDRNAHLSISRYFEAIFVSKYVLNC